MRERDRGVLLRLLAWSATGQPISIYTSHFHGPPPGAGNELHLVLVDNGRSDLLARGSVRRSLACIRCGACLNTCPVYRRSGGHSYGTPVAGPIGSVLAAAREPTVHASLPHACSLCGSCADVCPVKIDLPRELLDLRADAAVRAQLSAAKRSASRMASWLLRHPAIFEFVMRGVRRGLRHLPKSWLGRDAWTRERDLPEIPAESFRQTWKRRAAGKGVLE